MVDYGIHCHPWLKNRPDEIEIVIATTIVQMKENDDNLVNMNNEENEEEISELKFNEIQEIEN